MVRKTLKQISLLATLACGIATSVQAQDTLHISLPDADARFLQKNLTLLSEKYNIDIAQTQVLQARLYNNPNIQFTSSIYNPIRNKTFDVSNKTGEYIISAQQLIQLAGKRNKQIKLALTGTAMAGNQFYDLLRTLRFTLHSDFYQAYFLLNSILAYQTQINALETLNAGYQSLYSKGVVTLKDAVRIKSLLYSLKADQTSLQNQYNDIEAEMQVLLQDNHTWFVPASDVAFTPVPSVKTIPLQNVFDSAYANRYDLRLAENTVVYNKQNYSLQKALAVPDLTLGAQFDKRGSFVDNASFLNLGIDLPFFNRNQGNIKAASINTLQSKVQLDLQKATIENQVQQAYIKALNTEKMLASVDSNFRNDFELLLKSVTENFQKKNISLLEFTDFYDSYKENVQQLNQLQNDRIQAIETLNYTVGKPLINF